LILAAGISTVNGSVNKQALGRTDFSIDMRQMCITFNKVAASSVYATILQLYRFRVSRFQQRCTELISTPCASVCLQANVLSRRGLMLSAISAFYHEFYSRFLDIGPIFIGLTPAKSGWYQQSIHGRVDLWRMCKPGVKRFKQ